MRNKTLKQLPAMAGAEKVFCFHGVGESVSGCTWKERRLENMFTKTSKLLQREGVFCATKGLNLKLDD